MKSSILGLSRSKQTIHIIYGCLGKYASSAVLTQEHATVTDDETLKISASSSHMLVVYSKGANLYWAAITRGGICNMYGS